MKIGEKRDVVESCLIYSMGKELRRIGGHYAYLEAARTFSLRAYYYAKDAYNDGDENAYLRLCCLIALFAAYVPDNTFGNASYIAGSIAKDLPVEMNMQKQYLEQAIARYSHA